MKVALVTTPPSVRSGIGDYTRHLLPYLREHCDVQIFVRHGHDEAEWPEPDRGRVRLVDQLSPREFDQILYQLGNEQSHGFMPRMIRALGGTAVQHDWVLFDMAVAAWPGLQRGGAKGHALALREGGLAQAHVYLRNWLERRRERQRPSPPVRTHDLEGTLLSGWHMFEQDGRWTADFAAVRIPSDSVENVRFELHVDPRRQQSLQFRQRRAFRARLDAADHAAWCGGTGGATQQGERGGRGGACSAAQKGTAPNSKCGVRCGLCHTNPPASLGSAIRSRA